MILTKTIQFAAALPVVLAMAFTGNLAYAQNRNTSKTSTEMAGVLPEASGSGLKATETTVQKDARMKWWREAKFGLFLHWGIYAVPAGKYGNHSDYGEWIMNSAKIPVKEYKGFAQQFHPVKYDPVAWARIARDAGMRYIVITAKHHDGFALFPSRVTDWDVADATPYKKDLLGPLVSAARQEGLKIGFYYSQSQDWNHPGGAKYGFKEGEGWDEEHQGNYDDYLKKIAIPQVQEILTRYPIDILWWDTPMHMDPQRIAPLAALAGLRPGIITNNRLGSDYGGDTATPEQFVPVTGHQGDWETCMTMNRHWGYNAYDQDWKSSPDLIRKLAEICSKGGNFLLNIGPTAEGIFPPECVQRLSEMGRWLHANGESIYATTSGPFPHLSWGVSTRKGQKIYLHVFQWPKDGRLCVPIKNRIDSAFLLSAPDRPLPLLTEPDRMVVKIPAVAPDPVDSVVVLTMTGEPVVLPLPSAGKTVTASGSQEKDIPSNVLDGTPQKIWKASSDHKSGWLEIDLGKPTIISGFAFDEPDVWPRLHQRVRLEALQAATWKPLASIKTVGHGHSTPITPVSAQRFRLVVERDAGAPEIAEWQLYQPE